MRDRAWAYILVRDDAESEKLEGRVPLSLLWEKYCSPAPNKNEIFRRNVTLRQ